MAQQQNHKHPQPKSPETFAENGRHRYLQFTISGTYYNSKKELIDFEKVVGKIPFCDEEQGVGSMHVRDRFAAKWVREASKENGNLRYPDRIERMHQIFVDDVQETTGTMSFVGKSLKDLDIDEMQELAVAKDIRFIPLPKAGMSKRDMLIRTYVGYSEKVLKKTVKYQEEDFNFAKLPDIVLDGQGRKEISQKLTNDEIVDLEADKMKAPVGLGERDDPKKRFSLDELRAILDGKKVAYDPDSSFDELYQKAFSG